MKKLLIILLAFSAAACSKVSTDHSFFKDPNEITVLVKRAIQKLGLDGELVSIDRVSYLQSGKSSFAFVFYSSTKGSKSIVVKKEVQTNLVGGSVTVCQDGTCDCKVKAIINNDGTIDVGCSCSSCKMVTTTYASLEIPGDN